MMNKDVALECGWGRLIMGHTFASHLDLLTVLGREAPGRRDICMYVREPQVLVSLAPHELFIDPSVTYRLPLAAAQRPDFAEQHGIRVRELVGAADAEAVNRLYAACGMLTVAPNTLISNQRSSVFTYLIAEEIGSGRVLGTVTGIDHTAAFEDPESGSSLWCLAVDPQSQRPGAGEALVLSLAERLREAGAKHLDLSVLHDNAPAIALYKKLGFQRVQVFCVKRKNPINERLFTPAAEDLARCNPYARILADEAIRRGIQVEVLDPEWGELRLTHGGRKVVTRESLSELTSAVAMSRCDDKRVTRRILENAGLPVPRGRQSSAPEDAVADTVFLEAVGELVVKPARGEQGRGITVGVRTPEELAQAVAAAREHCPDVLLEEVVPGQDLRVIVIDHEVVAAAVRRPARVMGTGTHTIRELIEAQSRRRMAVTGGESRIPIDEHCHAVVAAAGYDMNDVLPVDHQLTVRRTANLHTGGTIHDVTASLHPDLAAASKLAAQVLDIPVVGLDLMVPQVNGPEFYFIEANERPGLANHEPQPTAARFIDLLFPATRPLPQPWEPGLTDKGADHLVEMSG
jgi:GNAT-family acetyltransferase (TIGR03103 family)